MTLPKSKRLVKTCFMDCGGIVKKDTVFHRASFPHYPIESVYTVNGTRTDYICHPFFPFHIYVTDSLYEITESKISLYNTRIQTSDLLIPSLPHIPLDHWGSPNKSNC